MAKEVETLKQETFKEENYSDHVIINKLNKKITELEEVLLEKEHKYLDLLEMSEREEV